MTLLKNESVLRRLIIKKIEDKNYNSGLLKIKIKSDFDYSCHKISSIRILKLYANYYEND